MDGLLNLQADITNEQADPPMGVGRPPRSERSLVSVRRRRRRRKVAAAADKSAGHFSEKRIHKILRKVRGRIDLACSVKWTQNMWAWTRWLMSSGQSVVLQEVRSNDSFRSWKSFVNSSFSEQFFLSTPLWSNSSNEVEWVRLWVATNISRALSLVTKRKPNLLWVQSLLELEKGM